MTKVYADHSLPYGKIKQFPAGAQLTNTGQLNKGDKDSTDSDSIPSDWNNLNNSNNNDDNGGYR